MTRKRFTWERASLKPTNAPSALSAVVGVIAFLATCPGFWSGSTAGGVSVSANSDASQNLRMGTWNVLKLGHGKRKDYAAVAKVIEGHFDVVALVEVMQKKGAHPGYDELLRTLGPHWDGLVTEEPRPNTSSGSAEYYAILFRENRVAICEGWEGLVYHEDNDGTQGEDEPDLFEREPGFACLQSHRNGTKTGFDFMLGAYHARWKGGIEKRREEVKNLGGVFRAMGAARLGEKDLIVAGDFNLTPRNMEKALGWRPGKSGPGSTLNAWGARTKNIYDYVLLHDADATSEMTERPTIIDVRRVVADDVTFRQSVSDHLPVVAEFRTDGQDDD